ncbi:MAG TPA: DUF4235 domain-containing protein [Gaiellaceae bacterium]|nr:DUF4235 domain-containing protein [Gaiellaceae bacterium]
MKLVFIPISVVTSLLAGSLGRWLFGQVWEAFADEEPPESEHLRATWPQVIVAAALRGAIFTAVRTVVDRGARLGFMSLTGTWPGEEEPDQE